MSFAGVSVIADGKLMLPRTSPSTASASGYHFLVVEGHSRTRNLPQGELLLSRYFTIGGHCWVLFFYPNGRKHLQNTSFVSLSLGLSIEEREETTANPVKALVEFSFIDHPAHTHCSNISTEFRGSNSLRSQDLDISKHLKDDSFTIRCDIVVLNPKYDNSQFIDVPPSDMQRNFTDLLLAGEGTDVSFRVSGERFAAHRCVLAARSTVLRAALFGPMKEGTLSTAGVVQIDDMEPAVFKAMLGFIYGDLLPAVNAESKDEDVVLLQHLLVAADRYDLQRLRLMCEKKLRDCIGVGTVTTFLALAEQHGCDGLKKACCEFLRCPDNLRAVVDTDGFDNLCRSCPPLMKDMILGVLPPKRKRE